MLARGEKTEGDGVRVMTSAVLTNGRASKRLRLDEHSSSEGATNAGSTVAPRTVAAQTRRPTVLRAIVDRGAGRLGGASLLRSSVSLGTALAGFREVAELDLGHCPNVCQETPDPTEETLAIGTDDGYLFLIDPALSQRRGWNPLPLRVDSGRSILDLAWLNRNTVVVAEADGLIEVVNIQRGYARQCTGHTRAVKSVSVVPGSEHSFVSGSRDGCVKLWDIRTKQRPGDSGMHWSCVDDTANAHGSSALLSPHSVTSTAFVGSERLLATGGADGSVKLWDLRKRTSCALSRLNPLITLRPHLGGGDSAVTSIAADASGTTVAVSRLSGSVVVHHDLLRGNLKTESPTTLRGRELSTSFHVKAAVSNDGRYVSCGGANAEVHVWDLRQRTGSPSGWRIGSPISATEVQSAQFLRSSESVLSLAAIADDCTARIWRASNQHQASHGLAWPVQPLKIEKLPAPDVTSNQQRAASNSVRDASIDDTSREHKLRQPRLDAFYTKLP